MPRDSKILATTDFPDPIPPVNPTLIMKKNIPVFGRDKNWLFRSCGLLLLAPFHTDGAPFDFQVAARIHFDLNGTVFIYLINMAMNTCNGYDLVTFLQFFLE